MAWLGNYILGEEVPLFVQCQDSDTVPAAPTAAPTIDVYSASAKVVAGRRIPAQDRGFLTGLFRHGLFLNSSFAAGQYSVVYRWISGSFEGTQIDTFRVIAGGDAKGPVVAMHFAERPHANYLIKETADDDLVFGKNPYIG